MFQLSNKKLITLLSLMIMASIWLLYISYNDLQNTHSRAKSIVQEQQLKYKLLTEMYTAARERSIILLKMLPLEDPFELDDYNQELGANARAFITARLELTEMNLSEEERAILAEQRKATEVNSPIQNQVAELFLEGKRDEASTKLFEVAIPGQNIVLNKINEVIALYDNNTILTLAAIDSNFDNASQKFQILGGILLGISALFIVFTIQISRSEQRKLHALLAEQKFISAQLDRTAEKLSYQASHDPLTNLINRREFEIRLFQLLERGEEGETHMVFYLDLDQFKIVNDTCGHHAGDELLKEISKVMHSCIRKSDVLARLGGDEFGILLEYCDIAFAEKVAQAIIQKVSEFRFWWDNKTFRVGASIGISVISDSSNNFDAILRQADSACYLAKESGRNRFHIYHEEDKDLLLNKNEMDWAVRLQRSIEENQFVLFAQQIVPVNSAHAAKINFEILIRLKEENGDIVPPGAFLPAAERYNTIINIDRWVVQEALSVLSRNSTRLEEIGYCSINLSGQSLTDADFLDFLVDQFTTHSAFSHKICLEITETAAINNLMNANRNIGLLRGMGIRFALDDFGSGLSSFAYLKTLPVDYLKIDGMFVKEMVADSIDRAMVKSIHEIGSLMGKQTIAEFVENEDIMEELKIIGVDYAQGYGIGKPIPLDELLDSAFSHD